MPDIFIAEPKQVPINSPGPLIDEKDFSPRHKNTVHLFSALKRNPHGVRFRDSEEGEKVLLFIRRSFITNARWIFLGSIFLLLPLLSPLLLGTFTNPLPFLPNKFYFFFSIFYYLFVASYLYINFISWYFNISLITNKRVIDIDFSNLIYKDVAATKISLVQDVSFSQVGAIRTFFNYGDVLVQTAGTLENFAFESAPQPENVVHIIGDLIGKHNELFR